MNHNRLYTWLAARSERRLLAVLLGVALASALVFLALAIIMAGHGVRAEHEAAARRMAGLFEASLKNAMLKRDLPGLRDIVQQLGKTPGVRDVLILNPSGEVRFAAKSGRLGEHPADYLDGLCLTRGCGESPARLTWLESRSGGGIRIAWPVRNEFRCLACHGRASEKPVNGILVVELSAAAGNEALRGSAQSLIAAGLLAIALTAGSLVWALRRTVLRPLARLTSVTDALAAGDLSARARLHGSDELARLGRHFDGMAEMLAGMLVTLEGERGFLQALLDAMPDPVLVIDASYRIVLANAAYRQLLGLSADFMGKSCHSVGRGLAEPCPATLVICPVRELASGKEALRSVITLQRADGLALDVEIDTAPLVAADGRRLVVEVLRPLGEKVRFSQEQRLSAIGLLANGVAHEIRNPLASIRIALQGAQRRLRGEELDRDALSSYLDLVDREIDRCVSITERLLRMSQPSAAIARPTAVVPAITETLALLAEEARVQNIKVETDIQPDNFAVLADDAELRMLTLNLAQNAFHAMPQGGCLSVTGRIQDDMGELVFRDSGRGIDVEDLPMIFMPFFSHRVDGRQGSGLGLAICKAMVERFGGSIHADSQTGRGSTFTVRLPLAEREHR